MRSYTANTIAATPVLIVGSGAILNSGEWWEGTGAPPAFSRAKSSGGVPPI